MVDDLPVSQTLQYIQGPLQAQAEEGRDSSKTRAGATMQLKNSNGAHECKQETKDRVTVMHGLGHVLFT